MTIQTFTAETVDDLLLDVYGAILKNGEEVVASRGKTLELSAVTLELANPLARLSRSEARGKVFSCLGELAWYLAGNDSLEMIEYYISVYAKEAIDGKILGAYGPRLFGTGHGRQVETVIDLLKRRLNSRRATIQLFDAEDIQRLEGDVPCTCVLQFLARREGLDLIAYMRSNDAVKGLPHDIFCFTMLQELIARSIGCKLGRYVHIAGSLHIYEDGLEAARQFLDEGYQSTKSPMNPMPAIDPWPSVESLLRFEAAIRTREPEPEGEFDKLDGYWQELIWLLRALGARKAKSEEQFAAARAALAKTVFTPFLRQ